MSSDESSDNSEGGRGMRIAAPAALATSCGGTSGHRAVQSSESSDDDSEGGWEDLPEVAPALPEVAPALAEVVPALQWWMCPYGIQVLNVSIEVLQLKLSSASFGGLLMVENCSSFQAANENVRQDLLTDIANEIISGCGLHHQADGQLVLRTALYFASAESKFIVKTEEECTYQPGFAYQVYWAYKVAECVDLLNKVLPEGCGKVHLGRTRLDRVAMLDDMVVTDMIVKKHTAEMQRSIRVDREQAQSSNKVHIDIVVALQAVYEGHSFESWSDFNITSFRKHIPVFWRLFPEEGSHEENALFEVCVAMLSDVECITKHLVASADDIVNFDQRGWRKFTPPFMCCMWWVRNEKLGLVLRKENLAVASEVLRNHFDNADDSVYYSMEDDADNVLGRFRYFMQPMNDDGIPWNWPKRRVRLRVDGRLPWMPEDLMDDEGKGKDFLEVVGHEFVLTKYIRSLGRVCSIIKASGYLDESGETKYPDCIEELPWYTGEYEWLAASPYVNSVVVGERLTSLEECGYSVFKNNLQVVKGNGRKEPIKDDSKDLNKIYLTVDGNVNCTRMEYKFMLTRLSVEARYEISSRLLTSADDMGQEVKQRMIKGRRHQPSVQVFCNDWCWKCQEHSVIDESGGCCNSSRSTGFFVPFTGGVTDRLNSGLTGMMLCFTCKNLKVESVSKLLEEYFIIQQLQLDQCRDKWIEVNKVFPTDPIFALRRWRRPASRGRKRTLKYSKVEEAAKLVCEAMRRQKKTTKLIRAHEATTPYLHYKVTDPVTLREHMMRNSLEPSEGAVMLKYTSMPLVLGRLRDVPGAFNTGEDFVGSMHQRYKRHAIMLMTQVKREILDAGKWKDIGIYTYKGGVGGPSNCLKMLGAADELVQKVERAERKLGERLEAVLAYKASGKSKPIQSKTFSIFPPISVRHQSLLPANQKPAFDEILVYRPAGSQPPVPDARPLRPQAHRAVTRSDVRGALPIRRHQAQGQERHFLQRLLTAVLHLEQNDHTKTPPDRKR